MATGAISFTRYVDIVSGVGAGAGVAQRQLIGRLFTQNNLLPPKSFIDFDVSENADNVGEYFGFASAEYKRAQFYSAWISKNITKAKKISFSRWVPNAVGSMVFGKKAYYAVETFNIISAGSIGLTLGGVTHELQGIDLSGQVSLSGVAIAIQTAIQAYTSGGLAWTGATVSYDATARRFILTSGATGDDVVAVVAGQSGNDIAAPLGWLTGAILCNGSNSESITETLAESAQASNNFGSFLFIPTLTTDQIVEAATWNNGQNNMFQFMVPVSSSNAAAISAAVLNLAGCALTLAPLATEYPEMIPMIVLAATDYTALNAVQNYEFQIFPITPSVTSDADADLYDGLRVNYYGQTQTAGQLLQFYQKGVLTGLPTSPVDQNTYANEQWLKDSFGSQIMTLLLALARVSANKEGRSQLLTVMQGTANQAVRNGTISIGKPLTTTQQLFIKTVTGSDIAWYQIQTGGYWYDVQFVTYVEDGTTKYKAKYTFLYAKDDVIRKVEGQDILI